MKDIIVGKKYHLAVEVDNIHDTNGEHRVFYMDSEGIKRHLWPSREQLIEISEKEEKVAQIKWGIVSASHLEKAIEWAKAGYEPYAVVETRNGIIHYLKRPIS